LQILLLGNVCVSRFPYWGSFLLSVNKKQILSFKKKKKKKEVYVGA
jgi:hypothetical protein